MADSATTPPAPDGGAPKPKTLLTPAVNPASTLAAPPAPAAQPAAPTPAEVTPATTNKQPTQDGLKDKVFAALIDPEEWIRSTADESARFEFRYDSSEGITAGSIAQKIKAIFTENEVEDIMPKINGAQNDSDVANATLNLSRDQFNQLQNAIDTDEITR